MIEDFKLSLLPRYLLISIILVLLVFVFAFYSLMMTLLLYVDTTIKIDNLANTLADVVAFNYQYMDNAKFQSKADELILELGLDDAKFGITPSFSVVDTGGSSAKRGNIIEVSIGWKFKKLKMFGPSSWENMKERKSRAFIHEYE